MSLFTTSQFASSCAQGADWREAAKAVLEQLESVKTSDDDFNFGFLYVSDILAEDAESILNLFKSVLNIDHWVGGVGIGICGSGESHIDVPAISAMIGRFEDEQFCMFPPFNQDREAAENALQPWLENQDPMLLVVTGDPMTEEDPAHLIKDLETICSGFMIGGLSSSRQTHAQFSDDFYQDGMCGCVFSADIPVATTLSQGCNIIGEIHTITRSDGHDILELDEKPAAEVFEDDLRAMIIKRVDVDPDTIMVDDSALDDPKNLPDEFHSLIEGEVHAAFPVCESDGQEFLVRNIVGIDPDEGSMTVAQDVSNGDSIMFVHRDHNSVYEDLSKNLVELRKRVQKDTGVFEPKGALYISCVARAFNEFEGDHKNELELIRDVIGDVPLTGFYAGGEISKARLYGYTGILTLFL